MKPVTTLSWTLLLALLASCGKGERRAAEVEAPKAAREASAEAEAAVDPATCEETARNTLETEACLEAKNVVLADSIAKAIASWEKSAPPAEREVMARIEKAFEAFVEEEAKRTVYGHVRGTIRHIAGSVQEENVRRRFMSLVDTVLEQDTWRTRLSGDLDTADAELNRVFRGDLAQYEKVEEDGEYVRLYAGSARAAQRHWIRYRDAWAELAELRAKREAHEMPEAPNPSVSMRTRLTQDRILELCVNPIGGEPPSHCPCWVPDRDYGEGCPAQE